jgi:large subunit ribosomal protein L4
MPTTILQPETATKILGFELIKNRKATQALHETIVAYRANRRQGTRATKTKATVAGSGAKPWRQKGTGRARAGYKSSPLWTGGGVVFGPQPRDFSKKIPKKVKSLALKKAISARALSGDILITDTIEVPDPKTRLVTQILKNEKIDNFTVLLLPAKPSQNLKLASRNIKGLTLVSADDVNAEHILKCDKILTTNEALNRIGQRVLNTFKESNNA